MYNHYTSENQRHTHNFDTHIKNTTYSHLWHPHQQHTHILDTHITNILTFLTLKSQKPTKNNYITNNNKQHIIKHSLKLVHCFTNHNKSLSSLKCANVILAKNTLIPIVNVCVCTSSFSCSILYETDSLARPFKRARNHQNQNWCVCNTSIPNARLGVLLSISTCAPQRRYKWDHEKSLVPTKLWLGDRRRLTCTCLFLSIPNTQSFSMALLTAIVSFVWDQYII